MIVDGIIEDNSSPTTYVSFVNDGLGFYKVRNVEMPPRPFTYEDRVLKINQGDTVMWENDADMATITIVSEQNLWNSKIGQIKVGSRINYKFDDPGTYTFHMNDKKQTIIVRETGYFVDNNLTETSTPVKTLPPIEITPVKTLPPVEITPVQPIETTPVKTLQPIETSTPSNNVFIQNTIPIDIPIKITVTTIASMIVAMLSMYITYRTGKK